ncbi:hypothetical protein [Lysinibacillus sp. FJAT-14222]|uniref:hypothetical protein n=1 Tax=Lysinibacillus sp. FJAT-14222 TaxID=1932366 RepID=UPI001301124A|nr:hypothetical protein [Lysinibacillus sp. FJAT-14222]
MTDIVSALVQARVQFKIRTHCLSVAKAKRQLQMFSVRKRSDSNNYAKAKLI